MSVVKVEKNSYTVESLYQWDLNQVLTIYGLSLPSIPEIHFTNDAMDRAIVRQASMDSAGVITADVPNSLLQKAGKMKVYVCIYQGDTFTSLYKIEIQVKARNKPSDYTLADDPEVYSFNALENQVVNALAKCAKAEQNLKTAESNYKEAKTAYENAKSDVDEAVDDAVDTAMNNVMPTLLSDETKVAYGLEKDATPDVVLSLLSRFHSNLGSECLWEKTQETWVEIMHNNGLASVTYMYVTQSLPCTFTYADSVTFENDGTVVLVNPSTIQMTTANYQVVASTVAGKYLDLREIFASGNNWHGVMKVPAGDEFYKNDSNWVYLKSCYHGGDGNVYVKGEKQTVSYGYVNSPDPNAYPIDDGYTYKILGQLGNKVRIATGSYIGTGTYGASNKNSLTYDFTPKIWGLYAKGTSPDYWYSCGLRLYPWGKNVKWATMLPDSYNALKSLTMDYAGNTVSWYSDSADAQANTSGWEFFHFAVG